MYKLCFYVPASHVEQVKEAVFAAGAGCIGEYEKCCWQVLGQGQFLPRANAQPFLGRCGEVEHLEEYRVEMVCEYACIQAAVTALLSAHPYEEPAWDVLALVTDLPG